MKNKIIMLILLCFYQTSSSCYNHFFDYYSDFNLLPDGKRNLWINQCTSLPLSDIEKQNDSLNSTSDICCAIILHGAMYYEGPGVILQEYNYFCAPAQESKIEIYLKHYGSNDKSDCIYCNGKSYCASYYIKNFKLSLLLLLFLLIN